ncbi:serine/threonine-protein kinase 19 homolog isoform X4 [Vigna umbellata]|uniref:serine/threonine-protein kinase 19 homolog isoform X4 n=1 Tax=Vigna umbellata TaxID=87088 RepID=UPI001F5F900B|nr:serine/threonine-protein kinase 19 homolog isoform X4 [Vigna umbellata]
MEKFPESSSKGTKRRRDEDSDAGNTSSLEDDLTFTDTSVALRIMRAQFPHIQKGSVEPFILKSQLYSSVKDRTQVDRELESLRRDKVLRLFKLNTGQDDHAVMFLDDYLNQIDRVVKRMEGKKVEEYEVFGWLKTHVPDSKLETSIEHQELDTKWFSVLRMVFLMQCSLLSLGGKVKDSHISVLINAGVLGRKEIISLLSRRRYKEMMLSSLEKKRLRTSPLDVRFHLRDLIGSGHLRTDQAPTGLIIRVSKD